MKRLSAIFFFAIFYCLTAISGFAQERITYIDLFGGEATAVNYDYKRVIKYKEPIVNQRGLHYCTETQYRKTGKLFFEGKAISADVGCTKLDGYDGQVTYYNENGSIGRKVSWEFGKQHGWDIWYGKDGKEIFRNEYVKGERINCTFEPMFVHKYDPVTQSWIGIQDWVPVCSPGKLVEESKFSAPADSPITGTWKYVEYGTYDSPINGNKSSYVKLTSTFIYSQNGVVESIHQRSYQTQKIKGNWKYIPKTASTGILEEYLGDDLIERGNVRFLSRNQIEYTITFSQNSDAIGNQYTWTRQ